MPYRLLLALLFGGSLMLPVAVRADETTQLLFNIIGGVVDNAIKQEQAKESWDHVDPAMRLCFQSRHGLDVDSLIRQGIGSGDSRLRPAFSDCAQYVEQERLRIEAERQSIRAAQNALIDLGYDPGPADGLWGTNTANALAQFQRDKGIPTTGQLDALSLQALLGDNEVDTVESGLKRLAQSIAEKSISSGRTAIAVLPFPQSDGTCSVFSTYIVDELILALFDLPEAELDIVERSRLESIISELALGEGGLLNPETTQEIGNISGASALTIGTITVIGESIRLNVRLVATDTGRTISAAAETIPRTQAIAGLIAQKSTCAILS